MPLRQTPRGLFLHVRAIPKASRDEVTGLVSNAGSQLALAVKVTKPADKGHANLAVIEILAKTMGIAKSSFRMASGEASRHKVFEVVQNEATIRHFIAEFHK